MTMPLPNQTNTSSPRDRKSTRLNSSHGYISYAVFCLKKKKKNNKHEIEHKKRLHTDERPKYATTEHHTRHTMTQDEHAMTRGFIQRVNPSLDCHGSIA